MIEKLRNTQEFAHWGDEPHDAEEEDEAPRRHDRRFGQLRSELPPPSPTDDSRDQRGWQADWSPRNWPRQ